MSEGAAAGVQQLRDKLLGLMEQTNRTSQAQQTEFLGNYISKWSAGKQSMTFKQFVSSLQSLNMPTDGAQEVFAALDRDGSGAVHIQEFCAAIFDGRPGGGYASATAGPMRSGRSDRSGAAMRTVGSAILGGSGTQLAGVPEASALKSALDPQSRLAPAPPRMTGSARATPSGSRRGSQQPSARMGSSGRGGAPGRPAPPPPRADACQIDMSELLLESFRQVVLTRGGSGGIHSLGRIFKSMDSDRNRKVTAEELEAGLGHFGLSMAFRDVLLLLNAMDKEGNGTLSFDEFMNAVRGGINKRRKNLILMAFDVLDKTKNGVIEMDDVAQAFRPAGHAEVMAGAMGESEALKHFLGQFDSINKDGVVTKEEFIEYYKNVSASIEDDDYFELMIRNAWHIPGGSGWCENTSNTRILCTFANGVQKVVMIEDDLGLNLKDRAAVLDRLKKQGVSNVVEFSLGGAM
mmetsp:Transcript_91949/g.239694  ORF Transcript_91949/g.239694 Transcript_91949/m.239694 type:complete len:462 (-) Transcript_91949:93-1478(-)